MFLNVNIYAAFYNVPNTVVESTIYLTEKLNYQLFTCGPSLHRGMIKGKYT